MIVGITSMFYFENKIVEIGTYESVNLLYMLVSQVMCGVGFIGLIIGLFMQDNNSILTDRWHK